MRQDYDNGKYTVIFDEKTGKMEALRYGEPWQDLCGNNLVYFMLAEHKRALEQRDELLEALKQAIAWIDGEKTPINAIAHARATIASAEAAE